MTSSILRLPIDERSGRARGEPEMVTTDTLGWSCWPLPSKDGTRVFFMSRAGETEGEVTS